MTEPNDPNAVELQQREWTKWSDHRPPNARGAFRYRATFDLLGVTVTPEWTEEMTLCGMGYSDSEWWPLSACRWDGYRRYITIDNLEWSAVSAYDPDGIVWNGLDLDPCPFTGAAPTIRAQGRYFGAPLWHTEALWLSSPFVPQRRWANAKAMQDAWNTRAPVAGKASELADELEMALELIQEAKGADGPNGGFVTNHLDSAEHWIGKVQDVLRRPPAITEEAVEKRCPHGVRHPWACHECEEADPMPTGYDPLSASPVTTPENPGADRNAEDHS
jgi:hypothetical protein